MCRSAIRCALLAATTALALLSLPAASQTSLVTTGSVWKYFDQGYEPPGWTTLLFDDTGWTNGPGQLGFGGDGEATRVAQTNAAGVTNIAFYFRHTFNVADPSPFTNLMVRLRRDDGAIVYFNGVEVFRSNLPPGPVNPATLALTAAQDDGNGLFANSVGRELLNIGDNQLAVEIHQAAASSTDISFDLELLGNVVFQPPTVSLVSPAAGDTIGSDAVACVASASDLDGSIASVDFFAGPTWLGSSSTPTNAGYLFIWTGVPPGSHTLTAVAVDNTGLSATSAPVTLQTLPALIPRGSLWKYLDDGTNAGAAWKEPLFDDSGWAAGAAELGFGDGGETTAIRRVGPTGDTNLTFYFRHSFQVSDPAAFSNLVVRLHRDDGAIAYLNGTEIFRNNMPAGAVSYLTTATSALDDDAFHGATVATSLLAAGANVLAVEIHQATLTSSDVSFDLELLPNVPPTPPTVALAAPATGATFLGPLTLALTATTTDVDSPVATVTFLDGDSVLGTAGVDVVGNTSAGYSFAPGSHVLRAIATDTAGLSVTSAPVSITVIPAPVLATLVATGSIWRFFDTNFAPATNWRAAAFDDSTWRSGPGLLGYGGLGPVNLGVATTNHSGPTGNRFLTAYYRHAFNATNAAAVTNLAFRVVRDDGVVVHLNGVEIFRMNMPTGAVTYATRATSPGVAGTNELFYVPLDLVPSAGLLLEGSNILAVELHQEAPATTDAAFDLGLVAIAPPLLRPRLEIQFNGVTGQLIWDAPGFQLLEAAEPQGPYTPNASAVSPYTFFPTLPARYYRLGLP